MQCLLEDRDPALHRSHPVELIAQAGDRLLGHRLQVLQPLLRLRGLAVALELLGDDHSIGPKTLDLTSGLEHVAAFGNGGLGPKTRVAGLSQRVAILLELLECSLPVLERQRGAADRLLGDLESARVLVALRLENPYGVLQTSLRSRRALVAAADAGLQPVPQRAFVAVEIVEFFVPDGGR